MTTRPRVAAVIEKPIQFYAPHYRQIQRDGRLDLEVLYLSDLGVRPFEFHGANVVQEASVLEGYRWRVLSAGDRVRGLGTATGQLGLRLWNALATGGYDAVWIHGYNLAALWLAIGACIKQGTPILLRGESEDFFRRSAAKTVAKKALLTRLFRRIAAFLYIGSCNKAFYESYGVPREKLFYVPYGVDNDWIRGTDEEHNTWRAGVRRHLGLGKDTVVFVFTSKHRHPKRPTDAVRAFCRLTPTSDTALLMLGDGELREEAERAYQLCSRGHRVMFLGLQPYSALRQYLAAADVMVFPSVENWGMALNEALAAGLAIVSSDQVAGWFDMVKPGFNGMVFRAGAIDSLAAHLATFVEHPELVEDMKRASGRIASRMGLEQMTDGLVSALDYALAKEQGREEAYSAGAPE